jgi:hypothetical protein
MDPFVVISFGKKVFRTRVIRHSLNPVFDEKLLFHVRRYETSFNIQLTVLDWDKLSSNDHIGYVLSFIPIIRSSRGSRLLFTHALIQGRSSSGERDDARRRRDEERP